MKIHPYIFAGIGSKPWITYSICDGNAAIERFPGGRSSVPLADASLVIENPIKTIFGIGTIKITSVSGAVQEWVNVPNVNKVYDVLLRVAKGQPIEEPKVEKATFEHHAPPPNVIFDRVAFIPPIPILFENLFHPYYGSKPYPVWRQYTGWVERGAPLCDFNMWPHWLSLSNGTDFTIYTPVSGLMIPKHFTERGYGDWLHSDSPVSASNHMVAILLPTTEVVPQTAESCFAGLCDLTSQHRDKLFWHSDFSGQSEDWRTNEAIEKFLRETKERSIVVQPLADIVSFLTNDGAAPLFRHGLEAVRQKYPTHFQA